MGFDICFYDDLKVDYDFNDVMIKFIVLLVFVIKLEEDILVIDEFILLEVVYGILVFEDQWFKMGDYDFNDFVMNYSYELEKGDNNMIIVLKLIFMLIVKGVVLWMYIGVGIELLFLVDNIDEVKLEGVIFEEGNDWVIFIVWNDVNIVFGMIEGYVNMEGVVVGVFVILVEVIV